MIPKRDADRRAYREWAGEQVYLPLYWQPQWLDTVAPLAWDARLYYTSRGRLTAAWPYYTHARAGLRWLGLPPHTPYGGPRFLYPSPEALTLPHGHEYGVFTVHQPQAAWSFGRACRALATQSLHLGAAPGYPADIRRLLRHAERDSVIRPLDGPVDLDALREILTTRSECGSPAVVDVLARARDQGFGQLWGSHRRSDGRLQGAVGFVHDDRVGYTLLLVRSADALPSTNTSLTNHYIEYARALGIESIDMQSGYLPGVRAFVASFGAVPQWYGQVRIANTALWRGLEFLQSVRNKSRI